MRDLAPLMQFKRPEFNATKRRLRSAHTIEDLGVGEQILEIRR